MNFGVIDVETCEPVPNVLVDVWHANATGQYAGRSMFSLEYAGLLKPYPKTKWGETFLRGAYPTDKNGVAQLTSIFPGYYPRRATRKLSHPSSISFASFVTPFLILRLFFGS